MSRNSNQPIEFPALLSSEELDNARHPEPPPGAATGNMQDPNNYHPLPVLTQHFPRIAETVQAMWGAPELDAYFDRLLIDQRGTRAGFPAEVVKALLALSRQHIEQFKFRTPDDIWTIDPNVSKR